MVFFLFVGQPGQPGQFPEGKMNFISMHITIILPNNCNNNYT